MQSKKVKLVLKRVSGILRASGILVVLGAVYLGYCCFFGEEAENNKKCVFKKDYVLCSGTYKYNVYAGDSVTIFDENQIVLYGDTLFVYDDSIFSDSASADFVLCTKSDESGPSESNASSSNGEGGGFGVQVVCPSKFAIVGDTLVVRFEPTDSLGKIGIWTTEKLLFEVVADGKNHKFKVNRQDSCYSIHVQEHVSCQVCPVYAEQVSVQLRSKGSKDFWFLNWLWKVVAVAGWFVAAVLLIMLFKQRKSENEEGMSPQRPQDSTSERILKLIEKVTDQVKSQNGGNEENTPDANGKGNTEKGASSSLESNMTESKNGTNPSSRNEWISKCKKYMSNKEHDESEGSQHNAQQRKEEHTESRESKKSFEDIYSCFLDFLEGEDPVQRIKNPSQALQLLVSLNEILETEKKDLDSLRARIVQLSRENGDLKSRAETAEENVGAAERDVKEKKAEISSLNEQLGLRKEEIKNIKIDLGNAQKTIEAKEQALERFSKTITDIAPAKKYAGSLAKLLGKGEDVEKAAIALGEKSDIDNYLIYKYIVRYRRALFSFDMQMFVIDVQNAAKVQFMYKDQQLATYDQSNPQVFHESMKRYFYSSYLRKYVNALVVLNETMAGLNHLVSGVTENDTKIFVTYRKDITDIAKELEIKVESVRIMESCTDNLSLNVISKSLDFDCPKNSICEIRNCIVYLEGSDRPNEKIEVVVKK